ncbi:putative peptide maturation dehydrogenase [Duganella callida]|uniref:Putative peptide maturation dehydrogenase n=1 Tax=Duganella callida TaxID=2561932 RepID=A0A4Y9SV98_9BURK|nr:putative peptide maturation dehydrogenase [Duganella callida]TFW30712.1 putative peptide maturation dehydrogenase [Duganella callida]
MKIRRCAVFYVESREDLTIDWAKLFAGQNTLAAQLSWVALVPHLDREVGLNTEQLLVLGTISQTLWTDREEAEQRHGGAVVGALLELGLLIGDDDASTPMRERDEKLRSQQWRPLSALIHTFSRWRDVRTETGMQTPSFQELVDRHGPPPPPTIHPAAVGASVALPPAGKGLLDDALLNRYTGRNFDTSASLSQAVLARLLQRTFGAQSVRNVGPDGDVLKKTSPSAGGLHPTEAYVLVQRVDGIAPGLYHYHQVEHVLRPLRMLEKDEAAALALQLVADQHWFAEAPIQVILVARVLRNFWKYRNHPKAYKAITLDAGHLSQTFYLLATEAGLPAFVTAAVNDVDIEQTLGLDHLSESVMAVIGCGPASGRQDTIELRPGDTA